MSKLVRPWLAIVPLLLGLCVPDEAAAIPAFARRYGVSCSLCHNPAPRLTPFGEAFAANGFQMVVGEAPRDTLTTGDELLWLLERIRFAFRIDAYAVAQNGGSRDATAFDLQTPWGIKLLSGGPIAEKISYYAYFFMSERGEVAGLEDAYIQFTDIGGSGVTALVGQFQISDPLFKRELRLQYEDYQPYRIRVGEAATDLTYDRGVMLTYTPWSGNDLSLQVVNGRGLSEGTSERTFDRDSYKNVVLRTSQELGPVRVGVFGLYGVEERAEDGLELRDRVWVWGPDATVPLGSEVEVNLQYLRRHDGNPFFLEDRRATTVDAGFAELVWSPQGPMGRWFFTGLYNHLDADGQVVSLRLGEQEDQIPYLDRYRSLSVGAHYLLRRNVRLMGEVGWGLDEDRARLVTGFVTAF